MPNEPRDYQSAAIQSIFDFFEKNPGGHPLVVAPTGAGKSLIIAEFTKRILAGWSSLRIIVVAHKKELLEQNAQELWTQWPGAPIGIYSAGLNLRHTGRPVTIAGIASVYRRSQELGRVDLLVIDEAHLVPSKGMGMYKKLIADLSAINPNLRVVGLTATPFRMDQGFLHEGGDALFSDICYEIDVKMLIARGYLSPLVSKISITPADLSEVRIRGGEYLEQDMIRAFAKDELIKQSVAEIVRYGQERQSWLLFAAGVDHAKRITEELKLHGIAAETVVGDSLSTHRNSVVQRFRSGQLRAVVNCGVFTTGFNARNVDLIALLRATRSPGLYVQIMGRGMRTSPETGKTNCLVLDFGGNIERHGPVDEIRIVTKGDSDGKKCELVKSPMKACPNCHSAIHLSLTECPECGHQMPRNEVLNHEPEASESSPLSDGRPQKIEVFEVTYDRHQKKDKLPSLKITYHAENNRRISEWLCFDHSGMAYTRAEQTWKLSVRPEFKDRPAPDSVDRAMARVEELMKPLIVWAKNDGEFDRIISRTYPLADELPPLTKPVEDYPFEMEDVIPF